MNIVDRERYRLDAWRPAMLALACVALGVGCNSPQVQEVAKQVQATAAKTVEAVTAPRAPEKGSVKIEHSPAIELPRGFATFSTFADRPSVLQVRSYEREDAGDVDDDETRTSAFPMVYVRIVSEAKAVRELVGKKWPAHVSIHFAGNYPQWTSELGTPVEVDVVDGNELFVAVELKGFALPDSSSDRTMTVNGKLVGLIPQPAKKDGK